MCKVRSQTNKQTSEIYVHINDQTFGCTQDAREKGT